MLIICELFYVHFFFHPLCLLVFVYIRYTVWLCMTSNLCENLFCDYTVIVHINVYIYSARKYYGAVHAPVYTHSERVMYKEKALPRSLCNKNIWLQHGILCIHLTKVEIAVRREKKNELSHLKKPLYPWLTRCRGKKQLRAWKDPFVCKCVT